MRVAIVGCRNTEQINLDHILDKIPSNCSEIISGGADGVDQAAKEIAKQLNLPCTEIVPQYDKYGRAAPIKRNEQIAEYCDLMIAVWDGESKGTRSSLVYAQKSGKDICVLLTKETKDASILGIL